jgi:hypothetical protein
MAPHHCALCDEYHFDDREGYVISSGLAPANSALQPTAAGAMMTPPRLNANVSEKNPEDHGHEERRHEETRRWWWPLRARAAHAGAADQPGKP